MRQKYLETQPFASLLAKPRKRGIDHKPRRHGLGPGFIKDEITLLGRDAKARSRKLYMNAVVEGLIGNVTRIGNGKASRVKNNIQGLQAVVEVLDSAAGLLPWTFHDVLIHHRPDRLGSQLNSCQAQQTKTQGPERRSPGLLSKSQRMAHRGNSSPLTASPEPAR